MGLDSVELVLEIEKYFGIQIPDSEAENIYSVQNMVDSISSHLYISNSSTELHDRVFEKIKSIILSDGQSSDKFERTDYISRYLAPANKLQWTSVEKKLGLDIPKPYVHEIDRKSIFQKIKAAIFWPPNYDWWTLTVGAFVTAVCANNYLMLIDNKNIKSKFDIYIAVIGITVDKTGVDYFEVTPEKTFTDDLGID